MTSTASATERPTAAERETDIADRSGPTGEAAWERRLRTAGLLAIRFGLAYLFFTQLFWKLPPSFGCPPDFRFTTAAPNGQLNRTSGLCDWIGVEIAWANRPHPLLVTDFGAGKLAIDVGALAQLNGWILSNIIQSNIRWIGWLLWGGEAFIALSLFLGLLTRLGGLVAIAISAQLVVGLAGITNPYEWEWGYNQMLILAVANAALAPGRVFGLDRHLRPRLAQAADGGSRAARLALALT